MRLFLYLVLTLFIPGYNASLFHNDADDPVLAEVKAHLANFRIADARTLLRNAVEAKRPRRISWRKYIFLMLSLDLKLGLFESYQGALARISSGGAEGQAARSLDRRATMARLDILAAERECAALDTDRSASGVTRCCQLVESALRVLRLSAELHWFRARQEPPPAASGSVRGLKTHRVRLSPRCFFLQGDFYHAQSSIGMALTIAQSLGQQLPPRLLPWPPDNGGGGSSLESLSLSLLGAAAEELVHPPDGLKFARRVYQACFDMDPEARQCAAGQRRASRSLKAWSAFVASRDEEGQHGMLAALDALGRLVETHRSGICRWSSAAPSLALGNSGLLLPRRFPSPFAEFYGCELAYLRLRTDALRPASTLSLDLGSRRRLAEAVVRSCTGALGKLSCPHSSPATAATAAAAEEAAAAAGEDVASLEDKCARSLVYR